MLRVALFTLLSARASAMGTLADSSEQFSGFTVSGQSATAMMGSASGNIAEGGGPFDYCQNKLFAVRPRAFPCARAEECQPSCTDPFRASRRCPNEECNTEPICACKEYPIKSEGACVATADDCPLSSRMTLCERLFDGEDLINLRTLSDNKWCNMHNGNEAECLRSYLSGVSRKGDTTVTPCVYRPSISSCVADWAVWDVCTHPDVLAFCRAVAGKTDVRHSSINQWCNSDETRRQDATACEAAFAGGERAYSPCKYQGRDQGCRGNGWIMYPTDLPGKQRPLDFCGCAPDCPP